VPLEFELERTETRRLGGRDWSLARVAVRGFAPNTGMAGIIGSFNASIRGHALIEQETGLVVEVNLRSAHPHYALRRELISVVPAHP